MAIAEGNKSKDEDEEEESPQTIDNLPNTTRAYKKMTAFSSAMRLH